MKMMDTMKDALNAMEQAAGSNDDYHNYHCIGLPKDLNRDTALYCPCQNVYQIALALEFSDPPSKVGLEA
jgi:hypothetical protein